MPARELWTVHTAGGLGEGKRGHREKSASDGVRMIGVTGFEEESGDVLCDEGARHRFRILARTEESASGRPPITQLFAHNRSDGEREAGEGKSERRGWGSGRRASEGTCSGHCALGLQIPDRCLHEIFIVVLHPNFLCKLSGARAHRH